MKNKDDRPIASEVTAQAPAVTPSEDRRGFLNRLAATLIGGFCTLVPFASGLAVLLDPLRRKSASAGFIRVASLESVPDDGVPRQFPVIADRTDAWNTYPQDVIGSVFLRREKGSPVVECVNATCPHAGCYVDYLPSPKQWFQCPCHDSRFEPNGKRIKPETCPSPRDMDPLRIDEQELKNGEVWVEFKDFYTGRSDRKER